MKISSFETFQFEIPLKQELIINNQKIFTRKGFIVKATDNLENFGYGEISPLPGLHEENLSLVRDQLKNIKLKLQHESLPAKSVNLVQKTNDWLTDLKLAPSVRFGVESALYNLFAIQQNMPVSSIFSALYHQEIKINGLLTGSTIEIRDRAKILMAKGCDTLKIKVGRNTPDKEIKLINSLSEITKDKAILRLDANRLWSFEAAEYILKSIGKENIEYIEEPLSDPTQINELYSRTHFPMALDESLTNIYPTEFSPPRWCKAFILKPTVLGSIQKTMQFIQLAEKHGILPVISDTFQSGVGLSMLVAISASIKNNQLAMGLDTYNYLETDILENTIEFDANKLVVNQVLDFSNKIDLSSLIPILL